MEVKILLYINIWCLVNTKITESTLIKQNFDKISSVYNSSYEKHRRSIPKDAHIEFTPKEIREDLFDVIVMSQEELLGVEEELSPEERTAIVDTVNEYRRNFGGPIPYASDMNHVTYDINLEKSLVSFLRGCKLEDPIHRDTDDPVCGGTTTDNTCGETLFEGNIKDIKHHLAAFYMQHVNYDWETNACKDPESDCKHFTQLMWGITEKIGCARVSGCFPLTPEKYVGGCRFTPFGNILRLDTPMYRVGVPCTRCKRKDGNLCYKNLCVDKDICEKNHYKCSCESKCKNCAAHDISNCACQCKVGWMGEDCSDVCKDTFIGESDNQTCESSYKPEQCTKDWYVKAQCKKFCKLCSPMDEDMLINKQYPEETLCCNGKLCADHHTLDATCGCAKHCPSPLCLYDAPVLPTEPPPPAVPEPKVSGTALMIKSSIYIIASSTFLIVYVFQKFA